jgi:hypothetical protein
VPVLLLKNYASRKYLKYGDFMGDPPSEEKRGVLLERIRTLTKLHRILVAIPIILVTATVVASMERTPLTGRCVLCCRSP